MKRERETIEQWVVLVGLVTLGVGLRFYFEEIPNFAPVAALSLFAGYYFSARWMALAAPISVMLITDTFIGGYQPALMLTVYGLLSLPVFFRGWLRSSLMVEQRGRPWRAAAGVAGCTLAGSILFFLVSNVATWYVTPWYPRTMAGLVDCVVAAIPFFRYTLLGDMAFASLLFGSYAIVTRTMKQPVAVASRA